jgi:hypothetical protein
MTAPVVAREQPEQRIHRTVIAHLRQGGVPGLVFIHVPNGGKREPVEAAIFKGLGVRAGVSDLLLWHNAKSYALELKAKGGPTAAQSQFLTMKNAGAFADVAVGLDPADLPVLQSTKFEFVRRAKGDRAITCRRSVYFFEEANQAFPNLAFALTRSAVSKSSGGRL